MKCIGAKLWSVLGNFGYRTAFSDHRLRGLPQYSGSRLYWDSKAFREIPPPPPHLPSPRNAKLIKKLEQYTDDSS